MLPGKKQFTSISKGSIAFLYIPQSPKQKKKPKQHNPLMNISVTKF